MANNSIWYQIGVALRTILGLDKRGGSQGPSRGSSHEASKPSQMPPRPQGPTATLNPKAKPGGTSTTRPGTQSTTKPGAPGRQPASGKQSGDQYESSPGQFGEGATRDVAATELRGAKLEYAPSMDGDPDPGEIIWTWVPYVENDGRGKDRPVLILGRINATTVFGCYVSSKYHRDFISIGSGAWDSQGRESFVSPERILRVTHDGMRREGATVDRERFGDAVRGVLAFHGLG
ncbi:type II toxin-antitoxin system PemK/MazF family toxin [Leucobacter sp. BZR 635]